MLSEKRGNSSVISQVNGLYLDPNPHERLTDAEMQQCLGQQLRHKAESRFHSFY